MSFKYQVGNLNLISEIEISALRTKNFTNADIEVLIGPKIKPPDRTIELTPNGKILYKDICNNVFLVSSSKIIISLQDNNKDQASVSLLGIPLGYVLQYNNFQVLHGSAVAIGNATVCFVGKSQAGKSSMALALINNGFRLVTEDLCIVKDLHIYNFSSWIKSKQELIPKELIPLSNIQIEKDSRQRSLYRLDSKHISRRQTSIKAIYFLDQGKETKISNLSSLNAFRYLFTYAYRTSDQDIKNLNNLTQICKNTRSFLFSRDFHKPLDENKAFLIDHLNRNFPDLAASSKKQNG